MIHRLVAFLVRLSLRAIDFLRLQGADYLLGLYVKHAGPTATQYLVRSRLERTAEWLAQGHKLGGLDHVPHTPAPRLDVPPPWPFTRLPADPDLKN